MSMSAPMPRHPFAERLRKEQEQEAIIARHETIRAWFFFAGLICVLAIIVSTIVAVNKPEMPALVVGTIQEKIAAFDEDYKRRKYILKIYREDTETYELFTCEEDVFYKTYKYVPNSYKCSFHLTRERGRPNDYHITDFTEVPSAKD